MTLKNGNGWITIKRGRIVEVGETAIECKAKLAAGRKLKANTQKNREKE